MTFVYSGIGDLSTVISAVILYVIFRGLQVPVDNLLKYGKNIFLGHIYIHIPAPKVSKTRVFGKRITLLKYDFFFFFFHICIDSCMLIKSHKIRNDDFFLLRLFILVRSQIQNLDI